MIRLLDSIKSKIDNTIKYVFLASDKLIFEVAYINKDDGKDILCVSTHTACTLGCKFCFTTEFKDKLKAREITGDEITQAVSSIYEDLDLDNTKRLLLVSYMGCGEPTFNIPGVIGSARRIHKLYPNSRFAIATLMPKHNCRSFFEFTQAVIKYKLPIKVHFSLHFTENVIREDWMPAASKIKTSLVMLKFYQEATGNKVELHYTLIEGANDSYLNALELASLLRPYKFPVKFIKHNVNDNNYIPLISDTVKMDMFQAILNADNIFSEYYIPPGGDVGASCGQFLFNYYLKYNVKTKEET